ncbi:MULTISPECIES: hypothetical protein [Halolamina]|uniref:Secreted glycoprotein n=1 Tax=Halolamina pelagica TaxID=699431 RepID=A0A1I5W077_9EURY|nr:MULTISPECIES: hypothetical protein [Halolamina]NHX36793.1 hypothetical protein [Halolamina sp. R1-12]SFQ13188.1 hypothetical protein SAMN05216277_1227 [Halolamina pelagica]
MTSNNAHIDRRTALRTLVVAGVVGVSGCTSEDGPLSGPDPGTDSTGTSDGPFRKVGVEGTTLVVELAPDSEIDQVNLIQPNGELWGTRGVAAGAEQVSFEFRAAYMPGEYNVLGLNGEETVVEESLAIQPNLEIQAVGLYRNHPDKPWEEVYGESDTNRLINGEAFVTIENTGTGPETVTELVFSGNVPNPVENPRSNGIERTDSAIIPVEKEVDLYSASFPFGSVSPGGMGCSPDGNHGEFTVTLETAIKSSPVTKTFDVEYSGSTDLDDCSITITEA